MTGFGIDKDTGTIDGTHPLANSACHSQIPWPKLQRELGNCGHSEQFVAPAAAEI